MPDTRSIMKLGHLKDNIDKLYSILDKAGVNAADMPIEFLCNDRSEGMSFSCDRIDAIIFDLIKPDQVTIELS